MLIFVAPDGKTLVATAKSTLENKINDSEVKYGDSNHFEPKFCGFVLMF